jgi:hypothetical protein
MVVFLLLRNIYNRSESKFGTVVYWIRCGYRILTSSVADLDPGSCASLTLWIRIRDPGSWISNPNGGLSKKFFGLKILKFFVN